jgi:hypothetical protein
MSDIEKRDRVLAALAELEAAVADLRAAVRSEFDLDVDPPSAWARKARGDKWHLVRLGSRSDFGHGVTWTTLCGDHLVAFRHRQPIVWDDEPPGRRCPDCLERSQRASWQHMFRGGKPS